MHLLRPNTARHLVDLELMDEAATFDFIEEVVRKLDKQLLAG